MFARMFWRATGPVAASDHGLVLRSEGASTLRSETALVLRSEGASPLRRVALVVGRWLLDVEYRLRHVQQRKTLTLYYHGYTLVL